MQRVNVVHAIPLPYCYLTNLICPTHQSNLPVWRYIALAMVLPQDIVPSGDLKARATLLKSEGNALFAKKQYVEAQQKFTESLELDNTNAIVYSNRAACCIHLGKSVSHLQLPLLTSNS